MLQPMTFLVSHEGCTALLWVAETLRNCTAGQSLGQEATLPIAAAVRLGVGGAAMPTCMKVK